MFVHVRHQLDKIKGKEKYSVLACFSYKGKRFSKSMGFKLSELEFKNLHTLPKVEKKLLEYKEKFRFMTFEEAKILVKGDNFKNYLNKKYLPSTVKKYIKVINTLKNNVNAKILIQKTYLMSCGKPNVYKIGKSVSPTSREKTLLSDSPFIKLFHVINKNIEAELHKKYKNKRIRGEWFELEDKDVNYILTL